MRRRIHEDKLNDDLYGFGFETLPISVGTKAQKEKIREEKVKELSKEKLLSKLRNQYR